MFNKAVLVADHVSVRCGFSSLTWVSDNHVPACWFQSVSPGSGDTGVVFMQRGMKVNGAHYCNVLLLKQLLQYSSLCQTAGDFCFPAHHT